MKADIVTLVVFVFCLGVLVSALDLGGLFSDEEEVSSPLVLQQNTD